jgi:hypothetical protein
MNQKEAARALYLAELFEKTNALAKLIVKSDDKLLIARALRALIKRDESFW